MKSGKSSISQAETYSAMGEFWDTHDLADYWDQTAPAEFEVDVQSETVYYPVDNVLAAQIAAIARQRGVSPETLLNLWLREKLQEQNSAL